MTAPMLLIFTELRRLSGNVLLYIDDNVRNTLILQVVTQII